MFKRAIAFAAALALWPANAFATILIADNTGGYMAEYEKAYQEIRESGEKVMIDGTCQSACTLVIVYLPAEQICIGPNALLGFHEVAEVRYGRLRSSPEKTRELEKRYPARVQQWITARGGLTDRIMTLGSNELKALFPACEPSVEVTRKLPQLASPYFSSRRSKKKASLGIAPESAVRTARGTIIIGGTR